MRSPAPYIERRDKESEATKREARSVRQREPWLPRSVRHPWLARSERQREQASGRHRIDRGGGLSGLKDEGNYRIYQAHAIPTIEQARNDRTHTRNVATHTRIVATNTATLRVFSISTIQQTHNATHITVEKGIRREKDTMA